MICHVAGVIQNGFIASYEGGRAAVFPKSGVQEMRQKVVGDVDGDGRP